MKIPTFKRLDKANFAQQYSQLIDTLATSLNIGIENLYNIINNQLSLGDNLLCDVKDVQVTVDSNGKPISTTTFNLTNVTSSSLKGLQVIKADNITSSTTYPSGGIFLSYTIATSGVQLTHVTGLQANNTYQLRIIAWG